MSNKIALYKSCLVLLYIRFFCVCHFYYLLPLFHILSLVSIEAFLKVVILSSTFPTSYSELILREMLPVTPCVSVSSLSWFRILGQIKFISHQPSFLFHFLTLYFFFLHIPWLEKVPLAGHSLCFPRLFQWEAALNTGLCHLGSPHLPRLCMLLLCWPLTLTFDKVCRGNPTQDMIKRSYITGFHIFLVVPSWSVFIVAFYIESVWIYSPFYFLHLSMISAFWMMLLLITALQSCWIFFCSSLHCFICCLLPCD